MPKETSETLLIISSEKNKMTTLIKKRQSVKALLTILIAFAMILIALPLSATTCNDATNSYGSGVDIINGGSGADVLRGGDGNDIIKGNGDNDYLCGDNNDDDLSGNSGDDKLYGKAGWDDLWGGPDDDKVYGGNGTDHVYGGTESDELFGGNDDDCLRDLESSYKFDGGVDDEDTCIHDGATSVVECETVKNSGGCGF